MSPPTMKNPNDVTMYMIPICFGSVVRINRRSVERDDTPQGGRPQRVSIGTGPRVAVTVNSVLRLSLHPNPAG